MPIDLNQIHLGVYAMPYDKMTLFLVNGGTYYIRRACHIYRAF